MLTSYRVKCPYVGCNWAGSLLPSHDTDSWRGSVPTVPIAKFECPECHRPWKARVKGDDVDPLPLHEQPQPA